MCLKWIFLSPNTGQVNHVLLITSTTLIRFVVSLCCSLQWLHSNLSRNVGHLARNGDDIRPAHLNDSWESLGLQGDQIS